MTDTIKSKIRYSIVFHDLMEEAGLSYKEYLLCNMVYKLQTNEASKYKGWCYASRQYISDFLKVSKSTVLRLIDSTIKKGFIEKNDNTNFLRATGKWIEKIIFQIKKANEESENEGGVKMSIGCQIVPRGVSNSTERGVKMKRGGCQNETERGVKMKPNNNTNNNIENNRDKDKSFSPQNFSEKNYNAHSVELSDTYMVLQDQHKSVKFQEKFYLENCADELEKLKCEYASKMLVERTDSDNFSSVWIGFENWFKGSKERAWHEDFLKKVRGKYHRTPEEFEQIKSNCELKAESDGFPKNWQAFLERYVKGGWGIEKPKFYKKESDKTIREKQKRINETRIKKEPTPQEKKIKLATEIKQVYEKLIGGDYAAKYEKQVIEGIKQRLDELKQLCKSNKIWLQRIDFYRNELANYQPREEKKTPKKASVSDSYTNNSTGLKRVEGKTEIRLNTLIQRVKANIQMIKSGQLDYEQEKEVKQVIKSTLAQISKLKNIFTNAQQMWFTNTVILYSNKQGNATASNRNRKNRTIQLQGG